MAPGGPMLRGNPSRLRLDPQAAIALATQSRRQWHLTPLTFFLARKTLTVHVGVPRPRLCVGVRIRLTFEDTPTQSRGRGTQKRVNGVEWHPAAAGLGSVMAYIILPHPLVKTSELQRARRH